MKNFSIQLHLLYFIDKIAGDKLHVFYSPALEMYGYGYSKKDAKESFDAHLEEFIRCTTEENTLAKELKRLGWRVKANKEITPPSIADMFNSESVQKLLPKQPVMKEITAPVPI